VVHPGTFFQVLDGELYTGVVAVEGVELDGGAVQVGEEAEVPPVGPELLLGSDEPGAAHDKALFLVDGLGNLGDAVFGVVDTDPGVLFDLGDSPLRLPLFPVRTAIV